MNAPKIGWIPVQISPGALSSEWAIAIHIVDKDLSLFADKSQVMQVGDAHQLRVTIMAIDEGNHTQTVLLPSECFENGSRWLILPV